MAQMLFGRFWLQNKDLGPSIKAIDIIFRARSVPMGPGGLRGGSEVRPELHGSCKCESGAPLTLAELRDVAAYG